MSPTELESSIGEKQDVIEDLEQIRSGADAGSTAYQKPDTGIPASDLAPGVVPDVSAFVTRSVNDLLNYYTKNRTYNKEEIASLIGSVVTFRFEIVSELPPEGQSNILYLLGPAPDAGADKYSEYVYANESWTKIGDTSIDLSGYVNVEMLNTALASKQDIIQDLEEIRSHANSAYQRPADGIPFEDLTHSVQVSLESADNALKPNPAYDGQIPVYNEDGDIMGSGITPEQIRAKANASDVYTKTQDNALLAKKATKPVQYNIMGSEWVQPEQFPIVYNGVSYDNQYDLFMAIVEQGRNGVPATAEHLAALGITGDTVFHAEVGFVLHLWYSDDIGDEFYLPGSTLHNDPYELWEGAAGPYNIRIENPDYDWETVTAHFWKDDFVQRDELQEAVDEKADTDGDYPEMRAGDLVSKESEDVEFLYKQTSSPSGKAVLDTIKGRSLVWNQMANYAEFDTPTVSGVTITNNNNGSFTVNGTATANSYCGVVIPIVSGHKYLVFGCPAGGSDSTYHIRFVVGESTYFEVGGGLIVTATSDTMTLFVRVTSGTTVSNLKFYPQTIDLTLMFGAGNEPSTVEEFQAMYHDQYYEYNSGELVNNAADIIKVTGFNQLVSEPINLVSKSFPAFDKAIYTKVRGGVQYYIHHDALNVTNWRHAYKIFDLEGNEITQNPFKQVPYGNPYYHPTNHYWLDGSNNTVHDTSVTFNQDCYIYIGYNSGGVTATTEMTNACLNIFNSELNGQYEPYKESETSLGLNSFQVTDGTNTITVNGLKSAGSVYDEIKDGKYIKRIGEVDLGTLDYELLSGTVFRSSTPLPAKDLGAYRLVNAINVKYEQKQRSVSYSTLADKQYKFDSSNLKMYFNDSASSNVEQFKSNNTGIKLYFELANPVEYDLVSEIPNSYPVYEGGTEEVLSDAVVAPFVASVKYPFDAAGVISDLTQSFTNLLNALKAASVISDGSVTKSGTTYTFTITA